MKKTIIKRIAALAVVMSCIVGMATVANASMPVYEEEVGFTATGSEYSSKQYKTEYSDYYTVKIASYTFTSNPTVWPSGKYIETTLTSTAGTVIGARIYNYSYNYSSTSRGSYNSTWKSITGSKVMVRVSTNTGKSGTITLRWSPGSYASL